MKYKNTIYDKAFSVEAYVKVRFSVHISLYQWPVVYIKKRKILTNKIIWINSITYVIWSTKTQHISSKVLRSFGYYVSKSININCHRCKDHLVLLITIKWCSFAVQNPKLWTYQMLAWYGNWLGHEVGHFYRHTVRMQKNQTKPISSLLYEATRSFHEGKKCEFQWGSGDLRALILNLRLFSIWLILCCLLFDRGRAAVAFVAVWVAVASCAAQSRWSYHCFDRCLWRQKRD